MADLEPGRESPATGLAWLLAVGFDVQLGTRDHDGCLGYVIRLGDARGWDGPYETSGAALAAERRWAESTGHAPPLAA